MELDSMGLPLKTWAITFTVMVRDGDSPSFSREKGTPRELTAFIRAASAGEAVERVAHSLDDVGRFFAEQHGVAGPRFEAKWKAGR